MKNQTRELLVITKAARHWEDNFDQQVEELMTIVSKVDTDAQVQQAVEVLDVYHPHALPQPSGRPARNRRTQHRPDKPFEFLMFRN